MSSAELARPDIDLHKYLGLIGDRYTLKILGATMIRPKDVLDISIKYDIPISACYRRVHKLEKLGLLKCVDRALTQRGKRVKRYKSCLRDIELYFEGSKLRVKLNLTTLPQEVDGRWDVLRP